MQLQDPQELDEIIQLLDDLLARGYSVCQHFLGKALAGVQQQGFDQQKYKDEIAPIISGWFDDVIKVLRKRFRHKYSLFHFVKIKSITTGYPGMWEPLSSILTALEHRLYALEDIILWMEERRNLSVRQEIAEKEHQADTLYKITYSDHSREVKLNNIVLAKPDFAKENDQFFVFVYTNPNRPIGIEELTKGMGEAPKKRITDIVRDLGFRGVLKQVFFPVVEQEKVMFVNPITRQYALEHDLPPINFASIGRQVEVRGDTARQEEKK